MQGLSRVTLEAIVGAIPAGVVVIEKEQGKVTYVNNRAIKLYGLDPRGLKMSDHSTKLMKLLTISGEIYPYEKLPLSVALLKGEETKDELIIERPDGSRVTVFASASPIVDDQNEVVAAVGIFEDITESKKAEEKIRYLASFPELNPDPIVEIDYTGKINYTNSKAKKLFPDLDNLGFRHPFLYLIKNSFKTMENLPQCFTSEVKTLGHWYSQRFYTVPNQKIIRIYASNIDLKKITEQDLRRAQAELRDNAAKLQNYANHMEQLAQERLEKLKSAERLAAIGEIAGMVGHDIRNPLQAIINELYSAKPEAEEITNAESKQATKESLDFIEEQVKYINKIISNMQDYSKALKPQLVFGDLCVAIPEAMSTVQIPQNIKLKIACSEPTLKTTFDLTFLKRVVTNLASNAVQAMPNGGVLTVEVFSKGDKAVITVEDTGVGILKETQSKLFTPLFTTKAKGQGLGLVVVKRMTEAMGGTISFESKEGKGTKFIIRLPPPKS